MQEKLIARYNRKDVAGVAMFLNDLQEAILDGWRVKPQPEITVKDYPGFLNHSAVMVYKEEPPLISVALLDNVKATKPQLEELSTLLEIPFPEGMNKPASMRKFLREALAKQEDK